ncbi:uncharacterized protein LOC116005850 [Ipomoea triloba]|uniref:uncharacterized protein LOC116005850 n=1 Tax=Ipomoea triloba TaxID=35885 RepID=UPI00125D0D91|nr:uncharacterized protein LOC116005850 [Ipomoea triloba]
MTSPMQPDLSTMCANLTLADVDDEDLTIQITDNTTLHAKTDDEIYAVGRLVTQKPVRFAFFQDTMARVWMPSMGVNMTELQPRKYLFRFYHEKDISRVITEGPWTYEQNLLIMKRVQPGEDPESIPLTHAEFWIQVHSLPVGFRSEVVVTMIGSFLGTLIQVDDRNFDGLMRMFYRVRVAIDVAKPLKKQMKLKKDNGDWAFIDFKYERLPTFYFLCGVIGHGDKFCPKDVDVTAGKPYGAWMRAGS